MGLPTDRREEDPGLAQPLVEGRWFARPAQGFQAVPEGLGVDGVAEQQRVTEIAQLASRDRVDLRLVAEETMERLGIDGWGHAGAPSETGAAVATYTHERAKRGSARTLEDAMTRLLPVFAMTAVLCLVACSPAASTGTASVGPPEPALTAPPSAAATDAGSGGGVCAPSTEAGAVEARMTGNAFSPGTIPAKVGDVLTWTNGDGVPHTATYKDDPACTTERLGQGESGGLTFSAAGTYAFFCQIHTDMTGTIEVTS